MLVQLAIIQLSIALCFAVSIFIVEQGYEGNQFHNMIDATWYALITMYTVGYGDFVPVSPIGRLLGTGCAILGLLDMGTGFWNQQGVTLKKSNKPEKAFSLPIIVFEFNYLYNLDKDECKLRADELTNEPTKEKSQRIDHFHKSLTQSLRRNKASLNMLSCDVRDECTKSSNMADLWNYAKRKNQFRKSVRIFRYFWNFLYINCLAHKHACGNATAI